MGKPRREHEPTQRQKRINEVIRRSLSLVMQSGDFFHADFARLFVHLTSVKVSPDLSSVKVYVMALNHPSEMERAKILATLKMARPQLRKSLSRELTLKYVPDLRFFWDENIEQADRIESLLRKHIPRNRPITSLSDDGSEEERAMAVGIKS